MISSRFGHSLDPTILRIYRLLFGRRQISPNQLSIVGFLIGLLSAVLFASDRLFAGGLVLMLSGFFDLFDGVVARNTGCETRFGGFLDSVLDRYTDLLVAFGILIHFLRQGDIIFSSVTFFAAVGVAIVPYARARAEAASLSCNHGLLERPERIALIVVGACFHLLRPVVILLAVLTHVTVIQRIAYVRRAAAGDLTKQRLER